MILVYGQMGQTGQAVMDGLALAGIDARLVEFPQNLFKDEFGYTRKLGHVLEEFTPDAILPVGHPLALSRMKSSLEQRGIPAIVEREELIRRLDSKVAFSSLADSLLIPQPRRYSCVEEVEDPMTVVFKRDVSFGGHGVHQPRTHSSLYNLIDHQPKGEPYLIEDYIHGQDYSVDAVRLDGFFQYGVYRSTASLQGKGPSSERETVDFPLLGQYAGKILDHLDYKGVCGFDFRVSEEGKAYILEANPRFTAGLETQIKAGFNIPEILVRAALQK